MWKEYSKKQQITKILCSDNSQAALPYNTENNLILVTKGSITKTVLQKLEIHPLPHMTVQSYCKYTEFYQHSVN